MNKNIGICLFSVAIIALLSSTAHAEWSLQKEIFNLCFSICSFLKPLFGWLLVIATGLTIFFIVTEQPDNRDSAIIFALVIFMLYITTVETVNLGTPRY